MGAGRIPWTALDRYAERKGFCGHLFDDLVAIISEMDEAYLQKVNEKPAES